MLSSLTDNLSAPFFVRKPDLGGNGSDGWTL